MDETRKIIIIAVLSIAAAGYGYSMGYLSLLEYYIVFGGLIIPGIGGYTAYTMFIRKAFSLHFQTEDGNHLREVSFIRIVSYDKDKTLYDYKKSGVLKQFWLDSRNTVYTDRWNKSHLFFPINNVFAYHPFAKTYSLTEAGDIPDEFKRILTPEEEIKIPDAILTPEENKAREEKNKRAITSIPIEFFTLMTVSALEFAQMFSGKLIIARMEALRNKAKREKGDIVLGAIIGIMVGLLVGIVIYPAYTGATAYHAPLVTSNNNTSTTTTTSTTTIQTIPAGATLIGESSVQSGNITISYSTFAHSNTTVTITHTTTK